MHIEMSYKCTDNSWSLSIYNDFQIILQTMLVQSIFLKNPLLLYCLGNILQQLLPNINICVENVYLHIILPLTNNLNK